MRTLQIRVHGQHLGYIMLGEQIYGGALGAAALGHLLPPSSLSDQRALCELVEGFVLCVCALTLLGYVYGTVPGSLELEKFAVFPFCWCFPVLSFGM